MEDKWRYLIIYKNYWKGAWNRVRTIGIPGSFQAMNNNIIKMESSGHNIARGGSMNNEQIALFIINERLYNKGKITREQRNKIRLEIKTGEYKNY